MDRILDAGFKQPAGESVLIENESLRTSDPAFKAESRTSLPAFPPCTGRRAERAVAARSREQPRSPRAGRAALVEFQIRGRRDEAVDKVAPVLDRAAYAQSANPELFIGEFGDASAVYETDALFADHLARRASTLFPITLIILVVAFGALVAAGIPLLLGLTAVIGTFGLIAVASQVLPMANRGLRDRAPDRPRSRRRLLDVLLEAGTRGTGPPAQPAGGNGRPPRRRRAARRSPASP